MNKKKNLISALILQFFTMLSGLILPRLIISTFGSEINGLVSSITQFLSFISLLEGGLGAVVLSELYKPIEEKDEKKIYEILCSCQSFFTKLSIVFGGYTIVLGLIFTLKEGKKYGSLYVISLVIILSFITLIQYLFSITNKLLLQAEQKVFIVNIVLSISVVCNLILSVALIYIYPNIHIIKLGAAIIYLIQPIVFNKYVKREYRVKKSLNSDYKLKNRWDGFAQNLAHFVNLNTDIAVITLFLSFGQVSVYSVYLLAITALRSIISSMTNSYQSALGKYYAKGDYEGLTKAFDRFTTFNTIVSVILFSCCILLINPFVGFYTRGVTDVDYYQPIFALIITLANFIYCVREPYRFVILSAGKFKETNTGALIEVVINLVISIIFVKPLGLIGVAIGTMIAVLYRFFYFVIYLKKDILFKQYNRYFSNVFKVCIIISVNIALYSIMELSINSFFAFAFWGFVVFGMESILVIVLFYSQVKIIISSQLPWKKNTK